MSQVCSQIVLKCWHLARIGRPDIYCHWISWHDPSQHGPNPATNAWIAWLHLFIIHVNTNNIVMWVILPNNADWDYFKTLTLREILKIRNPLLEERCAYSDGCAKKQTAVSHSSTESEIISLDTGLRLDGLLALELWDLIVSVLGNISHVSDRAGQPVNGKNKSHNKIRCDERHWFCSLKCPIRKSWSFIVCVWGQWSCNQD